MATTPNGSLAAYGAALTYTQKLLGYIVNEVESFPGVPATSPTAPFIPQNGDRVGLLIANVGLQTVYVGLSSAVGAANGFLLVPNGGAIAINAKDDFTLTSRAWWSFATPSPSSLYVLELIGVRALPVGVGVGAG